MDSEYIVSLQNFAKTFFDLRRAQGHPWGCQFFDGVHSSYFVFFVIRALYGLRIHCYFRTSEVLMVIFAIAKRPFVSFTVLINFRLSLIKWPLLERIFVPLFTSPSF